MASLKPFLGHGEFSNAMLVKYYTFSPGEKRNISDIRPTYNSYKLPGFPQHFTKRIGKSTFQDLQLSLKSRTLP
jgi:hypothetical protein